MKIIQVDGYGRENEPDILVLSDIQHDQGIRILQFLLDELGSDSRWFRLVEDDYRLSRGMEDFV